MNTGEATIALLARYGVDTVFGIPGVHTLELCRGLAGSGIRHVQARHEQGAGFMADGYARASGRAGVALVISGPGVTNALTPLGQSWADSVPLLLLSSDAPSHTLGKGWGCLHEVRSLTTTSAPLCALAATALSPDEVPALLARAFSIFASERPRPVHIAIPTDVLAMPVATPWAAVDLPAPPVPTARKIDAAADLLRSARQPMILVGGGARDAAAALTGIAERLGAPVLATIAGKGIVDDRHPLSLSAGTVRAAAREYLQQADVVLIVGSEMSEVDAFEQPLEITGKIIRVDIDSREMRDQYPADLAILGTAADAAAALVRRLGDARPRAASIAEVAAIRRRYREGLDDGRRRHCRALDALRGALPSETLVMGDICQLVYSGAFAFDVPLPRKWHYPGGYCTLGCALPDAIGARLALPDTPVVALVGDGGLMFTVQELVTAAELRLPLPILLWNNGGYQQIRDDMAARGIDPVGVTGINPDFQALALACGCAARRVDDAADLAAGIRAALAADRPTLLEIRETDAWLD